MIKATVKIDLSPLKKFASSVSADLRGAGNGPVRKAIRDWGRIYRSWAQERFATLSRGGSVDGVKWPPLKASTQRGRRKARKGWKGARKFAILRNTNTLYNALEPTFSKRPGALQEDIPFGVRVGFGGPAAHPGGKATIAAIASYHNAGAGHLTQRLIIAPPAMTAIRIMRNVMQKALDAAGGVI